MLKPGITTHLGNTCQQACLGCEEAGGLDANLEILFHPTGLGPQAQASPLAALSSFYLFFKIVSVYVHCTRHHAIQEHFHRLMCAGHIFSCTPISLL